MTGFDKNAITIDLSTSSGDNIFLDKENLIHYKAYEKIQSYILSHLENSKKNQSTHSNLSIFIDGTRGAGKSTFLKNAVKELEQLDQYKLQKLIYIDPSKIELNEHIFLTLIAQLNRRIIQNYQNNKFYDSEYDTNYELWRKKLKKIAGGLRLLNSAKSPYDLIDDDVFLDWGLDRADDAMQLSKVFKDLIEHACKILNCDAFLILIDDADTHFKKGEQVLEMVRRYLDIPELIVIMAGDLQLYSYIVRGLYISNMSESLYKYDSSRNKERSDLLDQMEDQYLKKLFPIQNRILLPPLKQLIKSTNYQVEISKNNKLPLEEYINRVIQIALHTKTVSDVQLYREFLLQQPLRSVLQLLQAISSSSAKQITQTALYESTIELAQVFRDVFLSSLYASKVEVDKLNNGDENALIESVFDTVIIEAGQDTGCYLRPQAIDENLRNSFVALASSVAQLTQGKASSAISYMLQCAGSVSLFYHIKEDLKTYHSDESLQIKQFKRYCGIGHHEDALNWAWHATAILMSKKSSPSIKTGIVKLKIKADTIDKEKGNISAFDFIKSNKKETLPFALGLVEVVGQNKQLYFSIFNILGVINRLLKIGEECINRSKIPVDFDNIDISKIAPNLEENVLNCLRKLEVTLGISAPNWSDSASDMSADVEEKESEEIESEYIDSWVKAICMWLITSNKDSVNLMPSSILLGKVWIRLYFSLIAVANSKENGRNAGKIIPLYVHSLINAFLVEEQDHHINIDDINKEQKNLTLMNRQNPKNSLKPVNDKLKKLNNVDFQGFPFTKIIASCPLIQGLIVENKDGYCETVTFVNYLPNSISKVLISGVEIKNDIDLHLDALNRTLNDLNNKKDGLETFKWEIEYQLEENNEEISKLSKNIDEIMSHIKSLDEQLVNSNMSNNHSKNDKINKEISLKNNKLKILGDKINVLLDKNNKLQSELEEYVSFISTEAEKISVIQRKIRDMSLMNRK